MESIIFCGVNDWRGIKQRPQQLAERLSTAYRVLYVNPISYSLPTHVYRRLRRTTHRHWYPHLEQLSDQLWLFTPSPALPFSRRVRILNRLNQWWLALQLRPVILRLGMESPVLWLSFPTDVDLSGYLHQQRIVFDCMDSYADFFKGKERATIASMEAELLSLADLVFVTAQSLLEKCCILNPNTHLIPNGVDLAHFAQARSELAEARDIRAYPHPRFGYIGTIGPWTDVESMVALAQAAPDSSVILIGPWEVAEPRSLPPNLHILGPRPYSDLPAYLAGFDVALIPFRRGPLTQAVNPVKLFEYAAAGVPIVATATQELTRYAAWCTLVDSPEALIVAALRLAEQPDSVQSETRSALALREVQQHDWQVRVDQILRLLATV